MAEKKQAPPARSIKPGEETLGGFLRENSKLFNLSELERLTELSSGTLRHVAAGTRTIDRHQYKIVQEKLLPKLCEVCFILQNYRAW